MYQRHQSVSKDHESAPGEYFDGGVEPTVAAQSHTELAVLHA